MPIDESGADGSEQGQRRQANVSVEHLPEAVVVHVSGEIDMVTTPLMAEAVDEVLTEPPGVVVFDLSDVTFFSSTGLAVLTVAHRRGEGRTEVRIVAPNPAARRPLELTGLVYDLAVYPDVPAALTP